MSRLAIPIDSIVVVPADQGVWSEELARVIAAQFAGSSDLRVIPAPMARAWAAGEHSPEEIARHFNARCVVDCRAAVEGDDLDIRIEVIDALAEKLIDATSYLISIDEAPSVQLEIARWIARCCDAGLPVAPDHAAWYAPAIRAKALRREGQHAAAVALILEAALRDREALAAFAEIVVDAPSRVLDERTIAIARLAATDADDVVAARLLCRFERDWPAAETAFARAAARNGDTAAHAHYGLFLAALRRFEEAERELRIAGELSGANMPERALVERGLAYCGRGGAVGIQDDDAYAEAIAHTSRGDTDEALEAMRCAVATYSPHVVFTAVEPAFLPLRQERAFVALVHELGLR